jgi:AMP deaminase
VLDKPEIVDTPASIFGSTGPSNTYFPKPGDPASQAFNDARLANEPSVGLPGNGSFDTEPHITAELSAIAKQIHGILDVRRKYIALSAQGPNDNPRDDPSWDIYPPPPDPAWIQSHGHGQGSSANVQGRKRPTRKRKPGQDIGDDFCLEDLLPLPESSDMTFELDSEGIYQVFDNSTSKIPAIRVPTIREFYMDLEKILAVSSDGPSKSFAFRRLQYLEGKFNLYVLLNEYQETADSKKVRKVDTHVHHSACMNQKHLLRFIKSKMKKYPNEVVLFRDGKHLTLAEVFASINLTAYDLSIDTLDMHVSPGSCSSYRRLSTVGY